MRTRYLSAAIAAVLSCSLTIAGCARDGAVNGGPMAAEAEASKSAVVEEVVRVPTAEVTPAPPVTAEATALDAAVANAVDGVVQVPEPPMTDEEYMDLYRIGPSDVLEFRSFDDQQLNTTAVVRHDGMISLPWVPDLKVAGHTRDEATSIVQEAYQELYYEAEVSLQIIQAASKTYTVMGDVNQPSEFPYSKPLTLLDAIISAGGLRINQRGGDSFVGGQGQLVKAFIVRGVGEDRQAMEFDLRNLEENGPNEADTIVVPGDVVYIPVGLNLVYVLGAVGRPGIQPLSEGTTILQLLAAVSGLNETTARMKQVVLIREIDDEQTEVQLLDIKEMLRTGQDVLVEPGDILYVPRKRVVKLAEFIGQATGVVTPILSVTSQAMGLYTQAFDVWYAKERADLLYNSDISSQLQTNLELLDAVRVVGAAAGDITGTK